ncbi:SPOR domain-containing protein [Bartonella sp. CB60]|uniref:SPOR domain-containing protein n=1 Tax=Bartonella sp. CB60 TaxID=3113619 RepID=UPI00300DE769
MSDNDRKNPYEVKQNHEEHDSLERLTQIFNTNKQNKNQNSPSSLQPDQLRSQTSETPFHGEGVDLSFLEEEFENNLTDSLPFDEQSEQWGLHKTNKEATSTNSAKINVPNYSEQSNFLSEKTHFSPIGHDEEQILDALSPLPIQKKQPSQNRQSHSPVDPFSKKGDFHAQSEDFFFDEFDLRNNDTATVAPPQRTTLNPQTTAPQPQTPNIQRNYDENQNPYNTPINHSYKVSDDKKNWDQEHHTNLLNSSIEGNTAFSHSDITSEKNNTAGDELHGNFSSAFDSEQIDKIFDSKGFPQKNYTVNRSQFNEERFLKQNKKVSEHNNVQTQHISTSENIFDQNSEREVLYNQKNLDGIQTSLKASSPQTNVSRMRNHPHGDDTPPPAIDTYKFTENVVEKTGPIMVPEVPYEAPEYDVPADGLKEEFSDVFNIGNVPEKHSSPQQQNQALDEIFHQTAQNLEARPDMVDINAKKQNADYFPTDNMEHYPSSFAENSPYRDADKILAKTSATLASKTFTTNKVFSKGVVFLILIIIVFFGYFHFFTSSHKDDGSLIIHADNTPFKFKQETTETENSVAHNLNIYKQENEQNEQQENTQQFLIDNSESPHDLASLNQQESESFSSSSNESDVEDAVTEAINHTVPTQEVQTVIVKPDGTAVLVPMRSTDQKANDDPETIDEVTADQPQEEPSVFSQESDINNQEAEHDFDVDKVIAENTSSSDMKEETQNSFTSVPIPSYAKPHSNAETYATSHSNLSTQGETQDLENYYVQLASQPTSALAEDSLNNIKAKFGFLIGARSLHIYPALIPGKGTYYRVRVQTQNRNEAINLCEDIKSSGGNCFVTR